MKIKTRQIEDVAIIDLSGSIVMGEGDLMVKVRVQELLDQGIRKFILNLDSIKYIDSSGLGELINCHTAVSKAGGEIKLLKATHKVKEILTITKLYLVFDHHDDEEAALLSFKIKKNV